MAKLPPAMVRISDPGMEWHEVDLNELKGCCERELAMRERVYPKWVLKGTLKEAKAKREIELMRSVVEFLVHCVFKAVTKYEVRDGVPRKPPDPPRPIASVTTLGKSWGFDETAGEGEV